LVTAAAVWGGSFPRSATPGIEIEVYEAALQARFGRLDSNVLIDERLDSAPGVSDKEISECLEGVDFRLGSLPTLKSLRGATFKRKGVRVVDGATWKADDEQLNNSVAQGEFHDADLQRAFAHALSSFSQIRFDKDERLALFTFSRVCGELCGSGSTILMKKDTEGWKVTKTCRQWMS
jgi:hypothetical protein